MREIFFALGVTVLIAITASVVLGNAGFSAGERTAGQAVRLD